MAKFENFCANMKIWEKEQVPMSSPKIGVYPKSSLKQVKLKVPYKLCFVNKSEQNRDEQDYFITKYALRQNQRKK